MQVDIPPELWIEIIKAVGEPRHPRAYRISPQATATLLNLCLVNHAFNTWTTPILYKRISLTESQILPSHQALFQINGKTSPQTFVEYFSTGDDKFDCDTAVRLVEILVKLAKSKVRCLYLQYDVGLRLLVARIKGYPLPDLLNLPNLVERCSWSGCGPLSTTHKRLVYFIITDQILSILTDLANVQDGQEVTLVIHHHLLALLAAETLSLVQLCGQIAEIGSLTIIV